jgi:hypothetical protein
MEEDTGGGPSVARFVSTLRRKEKKKKKTHSDALRAFSDSSSFRTCSLTSGTSTWVSNIAMRCVVRPVQPPPLPHIHCVPCVPT